MKKIKRKIKLHNYNNVEAVVEQIDDEYGSFNILSVKLKDSTYCCKGCESYEFKFNCDWMNDENIDWLADVISSNMIKLIHQVRKNLLNYISFNLTKLFSIFDIL